MVLEDYYYQTYSIHTDGATSMQARIGFLPDCDIFRGHFPGRPVCPGACNIQIIKNCVMKLTGQSLRISSIRQCRFTALATPDKCQAVDVQIAIERTAGSYVVKATMADEHQTYVEYKGEMTIV